MNETTIDAHKRSLSKADVKDARFIAEYSSSTRLLLAEDLIAEGRPACDDNEERGEIIAIGHSRQTRESVLMLALTKLHTSDSSHRVYEQPHHQCLI